MSWNLKGSYAETCSCELMCPCNLSFDHGATYDFCRVTLVFNIREGEIEGTDVGGLKVAAIADTPKVMTDGNWRLGMFIDERATDEQFDKLVQVFGGQLGGPMAGLAPLVGEMLGVERAAIEVSDDGLRHSVRVGDAIDFEIEDIVPFGVETGEPVRFAGMFHPAGRTSRWRRRSARGSTPSASSTRARPGSRPPSSPGPPDHVIAPAQDDARGERGLAPAFAAARARLGSSPLSSRLPAIGWWWTIDRMRGMDDGPWTGAWSVRLVPRRLGRDDGRDDVPVGRADGRALLAHDQERLRFRRSSSRRATSSTGPRSACSPSRSPRREPIAGDVLAWDRAGRWVAGATLVVAAVYD